MKIMLGTIESTQLANGFRLLCSGYANNFNKRYGRTGSLFRQKTKAKELENRDKNYPFYCFQYIHQNPMVAGLCKRMEDWEFSSFNDYCEMNIESFLVKNLAFDLIGVNQEDFYNESYQLIDEHKIRKIFAK